MKKGKISVNYIDLIFFGLFAILFIILVLNSPIRFSGFVISDNDNQIKMNFYDNLTGCILDGAIYLNNNLVGKTENGSFYLTKEVYNNFYFSNLSISIRGYTSNCFKNNKNFLFFRSWLLPDLRDNFDSFGNFLLEAKINSRMPYYYSEMQDFIRPYEVREYLNNLSFLKDETESDLILDKLANFRIKYRSDTLLFNQAEYWQTPKETYEGDYGDCEDWALTTFSLMKAYDSNLKCYNILWKTHVSIFCIINNEFILYDQDKTKFSFKLKDNLNYNENKANLREMFGLYFESFGISEKNRKVNAIFSEREVIEFKENDDFITWIIDRLLIK